MMLLWRRWLARRPVTAKVRGFESHQRRKVLVAYVARAHNIIVIFPSRG